MFGPFLPWPRRFKVAYLQHEDLLNCLTLNASVPEDVLVKISLEGVPPGTRVIGRHYDSQRGLESLLLFHESWPEIPPSQIADEIKITRTFVKVQGSVLRSKVETGHPMVKVETDVSPDNAIQSDNCLTVGFLDENRDKIKEVSVPYTIQLNETQSFKEGVSSEPKTSWRDQPPLL